MKRMTITAAVAILIASFATVAAAGDRRGRGHHKKGDRIMKLLGKLDLTAEQQVAIEKIRNEARAEMTPLFEEVRELKDEMREEWGTTAPDEERILDLHKQIHAIKGQLGVLRIETRMDTLNVLTAEQREDLASLKAERRAKRAERRADRKGKKGNKRGNGKRSGKRGRGFDQGMSVDPSLSARPRFEARAW
mgnify:CR=1 FL=1